MNVKLAARVLSDTVGKILERFGPSEANETGQFCIMMDKFFDCCNVRNTKEHIHKQKQFLKPYQSIDDERFQWLKNHFLKYFEDGKIDIEN